MGNAGPVLQRMNRKDRRWAGWILAAGFTWMVFGLVMAPPFVGEGLRYSIMLGFSEVCHQIPVRSPHAQGVQLAVCDRCFGMYAALAAAPFLVLSLRPWNPWIDRHAKHLVLAGLIVPAIDWGGDVVGLWTNTPWSRVLTGAVFGWVAGYFLVSAVISLMDRPVGKNRAEQCGEGQQTDDFNATDPAAAPGVQGA